MSGIFKTNGKQTVYLATGWYVYKHLFRCCEQIFQTNDQSSVYFFVPKRTHEFATDKQTISVYKFSSRDENLHDTD